MLGAYRRATTAGATLRFTFEGASLTLVPGPGAGEVEIRVDDAPPRRVSLNGKPVQLVRGSPLGGSKGWLQQRHAVTLTVVAGEVGVDGLIVQRPWRPSAWLLLGAAGLVLAAIWGVARVLRGR